MIDSGITKGLIVEIEVQLESRGMWYFGDLDPAGLAIPRTINKFGPVRIV